MRGPELHRWFWKKMAERLGARWYDERGLNPSEEWKRLLDQYSHEHIERALDTNPLWDHPPTHGRVAKLFADTAMKMQGQAVEDQRRGVWRSNIADDILRTGALVRLWPYGTRLDQVPLVLLRQIMPMANQLCEEILKAEKQNAGRVQAESARISSEVFQFLARLKERTEIERGTTK
jgi:hypothetical protein